MAVLKIARMGQPVLRQPAAPVADPRDPAVRELADDMVETLHASAGTGLAAPQVFESQRLIVFFVDAARAQRHARESGESDPETGGVPLTVLVNPDYAPQGEETDEAWEACLSIPGLAGRVPRYSRIRYWGEDLAGKRIEREAAGFHARLVQHEIDHLDGILYPQRMTDLSRLAFTSEFEAGADNAARTRAPATAETS